MAEGVAVEDGFDGGEAFETGVAFVEDDEAGVESGAEGVGAEQGVAEASMV